MTFLFDELQLSAFPQKGVDTKGITVTVPVEVETYNGKPIPFNPATGMVTAGIQTYIKGDLVRDFKVLKPGITLLTYQLSGVAKVEAYIMLDFTNANGLQQSYSLLKRFSNRGGFIYLI
ncbi:hypothetical protein [Nonlabens sp.]|uniref:hypothetical protein n=1 Tax=Nonlabens sp. TaxID=1888209 RepID=UPI003F69E9D8